MELFRLLGRIVIDNSEANSQIEESAYYAQKSQGKITKAFAKIGTAVAGAFAVDKIKDFGVACIEAAADAGAMNSQFSQVFGEFEEEATESLSAIAGSAGMLENRMKGSFTQIAAFAKTTGMDTASALDLSNRAMIAVADSAAFYDRTLEETTESLQSFLKGNYENDAALGLSCTETTRNAAANELYGKSFQQLSESQKQLTLLKMVEDANKLSGALGQSARESETWTNQLGNLKQAWTDFTAVIGEKFLPMAVDVVSTAKDMTVWATEHEDLLINIASALGIVTAAMLAFKAGAVMTSVVASFQSAQVALALYTATSNGATISQGLLNGTLKLGEGIVALLTGKMTLGTAATTLMTKAQMALNAAWKANPIGIVITALTALAAVFVVLWNRSEKFRNFWIALWNDAKATMANAVNTIKDAASKAIQFFTVTLPNGLSGLPAKMGEIGLNLVRGLWNGIAGAKDWVVDKVKNFGQNILNTLKNAFQEKSPSKATDQMGYDLAIGAVNGIKRGEPKATEAAEEMGSKILKAAEQTLKEYKRVHKMSIAEEVTYWNTIVKHTEKGTQARIDAEDKYYEALEEQQRQIQEAEEEAARKRKEQLEEYEDQLEEFKDAHKDFVEQIMDQTDLFDPFKISDSGVTGADLIANLQSQVDGLINYAEIMEDLEGKLSGTALLEKLKEFGTDSLAELQAINSMTEAQLDEYVKLYDQKYSLADSYAETSLGTSSKLASISSKISSLYNSAKEKVYSFNGVTYDPNFDYQAEINRLTDQGAPADVIYSYQKKREAKIAGEGLNVSNTSSMGDSPKVIELLETIASKSTSVFLNGKKVSEEINKELGVIY